MPESPRELATTPDEIYRLDVLSPRDSAELFRRVASTAANLYPEVATSLLDAVDHLPLAIRVAGRHLEGETRLGGNVTELLRQLRDNHRLLEEKAPDDRFDELLGTTPTIKLLLERSTDSLGEPLRTRFAMLGAFAPQPATFDQDALKSVWDLDDPLPTLRRLVDRGLLEPIPEEGRFQIHAVLVMHAQSMLN